MISTCRNEYNSAETGLYYLSSRYYDPEICRFINADTADLITATPTALTDKNLFAYCDNNPVVRVDHGGQFWDTIFDAVSLVVSIVDVVKHPDDLWAWAGLAADVVSLVVPFATGGGAIVKAVSKADYVVDVVKTANKVDNTTDLLNTARKVHGNSLKTTKETIGYALRKSDTHEIMKFGETTMGTKRYSQKFYNTNRVYMDPLESGSKYDMHMWQHNQILDYTKRNGVRPPWNKSNW